METRCPNCEQRLRLPDTYTNQRIRCRNCGTISRPTDGGFEMQTDTPEVGSPSPTPVESTPTRSRQLPQRSAKGSGGGGIGIAIVIAIVLFRGMPRLWKMLNNKDRDKPVPVEIREEDLRVLQDALRPANDGPAKHGPGNDGQGQDQEGGLLNPDETDHKLDDRPLDNASDDSVDFEP